MFPFSSRTRGTAAERAAAGTVSRRPERRSTVGRARRAADQKSGGYCLATAPRHRRRGSIIVAVLAFIVLFSFIVLAFQQEALSKIRYSGLFQHRDDLRAQAFSTLEATLAVINALREIDGGLYAPVQGWGNPRRFLDLPEEDGIRLSVTVTDESGRIPLRDVEYETLIRVFEYLELDMLEGQTLADTLLDWMDEDDEARIRGFDGDDYLRLNPPYRPRNAPLRTWDELELVYGYRDAFWDEDGNAKPQLRRFRNLFSLDHTDPVNVNTASQDVLAVLHELNAVDAYMIQDYRAGADGQLGTAEDRPIRSRDELFFPTRSRLAGYESSLLRVEVEARRGEARFLLSALVRWRGADPGAGGSTRGRDAVSSPDRSQAREDRRAGDARGTARTARGDSARLGYPFEVVHLIENRRM